MIEENKEYFVSHLGKNHKKELFSCGIEELDRYLKTQAGQDLKKNVAVTYVVSYKNSDQILGYYSLSSIGILPGDLPENIIHKLPKYPVLPGVLIGRLAVDKNFHGKKIGSILLIDALKQSISVSNQIGIVAVIVDAKNAEAISFYKHFGFVQFPQNINRLFLPISTIKQLQI